MPKEQDLFRQTLSMVGETVELGVISSGERLVAEIINAMFDSMLIRINGTNRVIAYRDIAYLYEANTTKAA